MDFFQSKNVRKVVRITPAWATILTPLFQARNNITSILLHHPAISYFLVLLEHQLEHF